MRAFIAGLLFSLCAVTVNAAQGTSASATAPAEPSRGLLHEPSILSVGIDVAAQLVKHDDGRRRSGFYPELDIVTGAGWVSAGPGYRKYLFNGHALIDTSAAISWRAYKQAQARFELPELVDGRARLGVQTRWQDLTQVNYFGRGPDSVESQRSAYRFKNTDVLGYGAVRPAAWVTLTGRFGWLDTPKLSSPTGPFDGGVPNALDVFAGEPGIAAPTGYLHGEFGITSDSRNHPDHPTKGGVYRVSAGAYADRDGHGLGFRRYDAEAMQVIPIAGELWQVAIRGRGVFSDASRGHEVPFYMLPSLGGDHTLRGFGNFRFHDRHLLLASAESRLALYEHVDASVFFDAGNVAPRASELNLAKTAYGVGVRVHSETSTVARLDLGRGRDGWRVYFSVNDAFSQARRSERSRMAPFVP